MDTDSRRTPPATGNDVGSTTLINAVIGAVAGVLLSFVSFSTLLGGAIAGYLEGGETGDGAKVGTIAGAPPCSGQ